MDPIGVERRVGHWRGESLTTGKDQVGQRVCGKRSVISFDYPEWKVGLLIIVNA
ncbi:MAG: hypothetical protein CM1200mP3_05460 [Chloroflexota bacterium]|nr:MAG: hypothetical protein CM1200mP3_05460 [Chloroflexota bacterium]